MKIVTVYLDDYGKPLVGRLVINDDRVAEAVERLKIEAGSDYVVEVSEPDDMESVLAELRDLIGEDEEEES